MGLRSEGEEAFSDGTDGFIPGHELGWRDRSGLPVQPQTGSRGKESAGCRAVHAEGAGEVQGQVRGEQPRISD